MLKGAEHLERLQGILSSFVLKQRVLVICF